MLEFVKQTLFYVVRSDSHHEVEAVGSFRRGKATCGDIDILVTRRDGGVEKGLLTQLVIELERRGFITDHITQPRPFDGKRSVNYMGVCQLDGGLHHRIDLKLYPVDQYAFALLYFTGSDLFNREMRMNAAERGLILGDSGIRRKERNVGKPMQNSKLCACFTEKDVFKLLDMEYRPPSQREL
jgi:DNA polymerase lambda